MIEPTTDLILRKDDQAFIETYAERIARKAREKKLQDNPDRVIIPRGVGKRKRRLRDGTVVDDAFKAKFKRLWESKVSVKQIIGEMGLSSSYVMKLRAELGLPGRFVRGVNRRKLGKTVPVHLQIDRELWDRASQHIWRRYRSRKHYVESLIRRDIG